MGSNATFGQVRLLGLALAGLAAIALSPGASAAPVGVTSGADGKPLGKPPNDNERVLRIGIDVQANERVTTAANDRAHLVFMDGSSLTVGPNAELVIDKFVYDPNTQQGELAINAGKGVFRLVGGKISKKSEITITTPSSTIGIRGGIGFFTVTSNKTSAYFAYGQYLKMSGGGGSVTLTRSGSESSTTKGEKPSPPVVGEGSLNGALGQLEGSNSNSNNSADQKSQQSGFSSQNSGQPFLNPPNFNQNPPNPNNNTLTNALSNSNPASQPVGNSTPTNQLTTKTFTATNSNSVTNPTTNINTSTNTNTSTSPTTSVSTTTSPNPNPTPTPPPSGSTLNGFGSGLVIVTRGHMRGEDSDHGHRYATRPTNLSLGTTVSITTDPANSEAKG